MNEAPAVGTLVSWNGKLYTIAYTHNGAAGFGKVYGHEMVKDGSRRKLNGRMRGVTCHRLPIAELTIV